MLALIKMDGFVANLVALLVAALLVAIVVAVQRERLMSAASTRSRRIAIGGALIVVQLLVAVAISAIDFQKALSAGAFTPPALTAFHWLMALTSVGVGLEVFVLVQADAAERDRGVLSEVRRERDFQNLVSRTFLGVVSLKRKRFKELRSAEDLLAAMKPAEQLARMVVSCWELINHLLVEHCGTGRQLRVAYFRFRDGRMSMAHCYNGTSDDCVSVRDPDMVSRLRFDHPTGCLAVAAAKNGANYLIPDTVAAANNTTSPFVFFEKSQAERVKSIAALPIRLDGDTAPHAVLMVDTDVKGFFDSTLEVPLQQVITNLAHRLHLEELIGQIPGVN
jgi:hypothetical protein